LSEISLKPVTWVSEKFKYIPVNLLKTPGHLNLEMDVTDGLNIQLNNAVQHTKARKVYHIFQQKMWILKIKRMPKKITDL
jgi:hypothetical protein